VYIGLEVSSDEELETSVMDDVTEIASSFSDGVGVAAVDVEAHVFSFCLRLHICLVGATG